MVAAPRCPKIYTHTNAMQHSPAATTTTMSSPQQQQRSANAVGGRTARACDGCIRRRARWYCAADDAFLCQACDSSVHSANPLARRHHRLRLNTSSSSPSAAGGSVDVPAWHHGFKRKPRTPRAKPNATPPAGKAGPLVPDLLESEAEVDVASGDEEEQLLYRVPVFDPLLPEFCSPPRMDLELDVFQPPIEEVKPPPPPAAAAEAAPYTDGLAGFCPTDMELADFAADVESLLGKGLDDVEAFCMEGLGILEAREEEDGGRVKMEMEGGGMVGVSDHDQCHDEMGMETLDINFDCYSPPAMPEEEEEEGVSERRLSLRLDYDAVVAEWSVKGCSPWTDGERPAVNLNDCWHDFMGMSGGGGGGGEATAIYGQMTSAAGDGGREARVSRYREKRRTRLFSKKIRYEVRKLNAEKRPRMKGRFVKRTSFPSTTAVANGFPY